LVSFRNAFEAAAAQCSPERRAPRALTQRTLGLAKPRPNRKPKPAYPFAPRIDAELLLESESKTCNAIVEDSPFNPKILFIEEQARR
jgi:hypothetical protein